MEKLIKCYPTFLNTYFPHYTFREKSTILFLWLLMAIHFCLYWTFVAPNCYPALFEIVVIWVLLTWIMLKKIDKYNLRVLERTYHMRIFSWSGKRDEIQRELCMRRIVKMRLSTEYDLTQEREPDKSKIMGPLKNLTAFLTGVMFSALTLLFNDTDRKTRLILLCIGFSIMILILYVAWGLLRDISKTRYKKSRFVYDCFRRMSIGR